MKAAIWSAFLLSLVAFGSFASNFNTVDPGTFDPSMPIMITAPNKTRSGFGSGSLQAWPTDIEQASGCYISG